MKKIVCNKCKWFVHFPIHYEEMKELEKGTLKCVNCDSLLGKKNIQEDNIKSIPVDWTKVKDEDL